MGSTRCTSRRIKYGLTPFTGHGAPAVLSQAYLEGVYTEFYPDVAEDQRGIIHFFRQFSFPGGIGSYATPETPRSLHEGGELGYSLSHAFGTVFNHPDLISLTVVGDGESETGPLATSWHGNKVLEPHHGRYGSAGAPSEWERGPLISHEASLTIV